MRLAKTVEAFAADDSALAVSEYGLLLALVAVALVVVVRTVGADLARWFASSSTEFTRQ